MTSEFDIERFDGLLRESLHQAAVKDVSEDELVTLLRTHAQKIDDRGLDAHAGVTTSRPACQTTASGRKSQIRRCKTCPHHRLLVRLFIRLG